MKFLEVSVIYQWNTWEKAGLVKGAKDIVKIRLIDTQPEKIIVKFSHSFP